LHYKQQQAKRFPVQDQLQLFQRVRSVLPLTVLILYGQLHPACHRGF
jgi:hypothetical protein